MSQEKSEEATTTKSTESVSASHVESLLQPFVEGDAEPLATTFRDEVEDNLIQMLTQKIGAPEPIFNGATEALDRLLKAILAQSGQIESIDVEETTIEGDGWDTHHDCGNQDATSHWETTIRCQNGAHQIGLGFANREVAELAFLDEYSPSESVGTADVTEREITFTNEGLEIGGTLTTPAGSDPTSCVVLVHGAGTADRNFEMGAQQILKDIAWGLAERGIASYRYDKRSYLTELDPSKLGVNWPVVDDAIAATEAIAELPIIDEERLFLAGHSRGGMSAPLIAKQWGNYRGIVVLDGYAQPYPEYMAEAMSAQLESDETTEREREVLSEYLSKIEEAIEDGVDSTMAEMLGVPEQYLEELAEYDKTGVTSSLDIPFLVFQGGADVPSFKRASADLWRDTLTDPDSKVIYSEEHNHYLQRCHEDSAGIEPMLLHGNVDTQVLDSIAEWTARVGD